MSCQIEHTQDQTMLCELLNPQMNCDNKFLSIDLHSFCLYKRDNLIL